MDLKRRSAGEMFPAVHTTKGLSGVGVPVKNVNLEVSLLAGRHIGAVGTVPAPEGLHNHHMCQPGKLSAAHA